MISIPKEDMSSFTTRTRTSFRYPVRFVEAATTLMFRAMRVAPSGWVLPAYPIPIPVTDSGGAMIAILIAGIGLMIIGYVGMFFANLIKASISRQREFLADASAVQFTRNPDGIGGALKKIGALSEGSKITHPMARDASHLFFGTALSGNAFATHPPLQERQGALMGRLQE